MSFHKLFRSIPKFLILSILFHGVVMMTSLWLNQLNSFQQSETKKTQAINVEIIESQSPSSIPKRQAEVPKNKRIVDQEKVNDVVDPKADLLSSHNQKVNKETVAKNHGAFQNQKQQRQQAEPKTQLQPESAASNKVKEAIPKIKQVALPQDVFGTYKSSLTKALERQKKLENKNAQQGGDVSRSRDYLPDKEEGLETLLSTREFVYYTYYTRIRNQLSEYWEPKIKQKVLNMFKQGRKIASVDDHITKLQIVLDAKGILMKVQVLDASGIQDLDEVAVEAFRAAAPFPNPPKGIIESDGTVKIEWDFVVET